MSEFQDTVLQDRAQQLHGHDAYDGVLKPHGETLFSRHALKQLRGGIWFAGTSYAGKEQSATGAALEFHMRPVNYGLLNTLALWCGFRPMPEADESPGDSPAAPEGTAQFGVAIWSNIPADLPAASIEVRWTPCKAVLKLDVWFLRDHIVHVQAEIWSGRAPSAKVSQQLLATVTCSGMHKSTA